MSFEGYYQRLCANGHYDHQEVYEEQEPSCFYCGEPFVWEYLVDQTNGPGEPYKLETKIPAKYDEKGLVSPVICKIPGKDE